VPKRGGLTVFLDVVRSAQKKAQGCGDANFWGGCHGNLTWGQCKNKLGRKKLIGGSTVGGEKECINTPRNALGRKGGRKT